jgi:hypothetical protein
MFSKSWLIILALGVGFGLGLGLSHHASLTSTYAQESAQTDKLLVQGHGRASSALHPPGEQFTLSAANAPQGSFKVIPAGKQFVLTDVMYEAQGNVRQALTVNIANADPATSTHAILFQVSLAPGKSEQVHLCSGYVIPAGHTLVAFTNAGLEPEQYVSVSVTGYLADE